MVDKLIEISPTKEAFSDFGKEKGTAIIRRADGSVEFVKSGRTVARETAEGKFSASPTAAILKTDKGEVTLKQRNGSFSLTPKSQERAKRIFGGELKSFKVSPSEQQGFVNLVSRRVKIRSSSKTKPFELGDKPVEFFDDPRFTNVKRVVSGDQSYLTGVMEIPISSGVAAKIKKDFDDTPSRFGGGEIVELDKPKTITRKIRRKLGEVERKLVLKAEKQPSKAFESKLLAIGASALKPFVDIAVLQQDLVTNPKKTISNLGQGLLTLSSNPKYYAERFGEDLRDRPTDVAGQMVGGALLYKGLGKVIKLAKGKPVKTLSVRLGKARYVPHKKEWVVTANIKTKVGKKIINSRSTALIKITKRGKLSISASKGLLSIKAKKNLERIFNTRGLGFEVAKKGGISRIIASGELLTKGKIIKKIFRKAKFKRAFLKKRIFARSNVLVGELKKDLIGDIAGTTAFRRTKLRIFKNAIYVTFDKPISAIERSKIMQRLRLMNLKPRVINITQWKKLSRVINKLKKNKKRYKGYKPIQLDASVGLTKIERLKARTLTVLRKIKSPVTKKSIKKTINKGKGFKIIKVRRKIKNKIHSDNLVIKTPSFNKLSSIDKKNITSLIRNQSSLIEAWFKAKQITKAQLFGLVQSGIITSALASKLTKVLRAKVVSKAKAKVVSKAKVKQRAKARVKARAKIKQRARTKARLRKKALLKAKKRAKPITIPPVIPPPLIVPKIIIPPIPKLPPKARFKLQKGKSVKLNKKSLRYLPSLRGIFRYNYRGKTIPKARVTQLLKKGFTGLEVRAVVSQRKRRLRVVRMKRKLTPRQKNILLLRLKKARAIRMRNLRRKKKR